MPTTYETTPAHAAIFSAVEDANRNLIISAVAGSGKTTTVVRALEHIPASKKCLFLAFNKKIATELQSRVPKHVKAQTLNSLGHGAHMGWMRCNELDPAKLVLDPNKVFTLAQQVCTERDVTHAIGAVTKLVRLGKASGIAPRTTEAVAAVLPDTDASWLDLIDHHDLDAPRQGEKDMAEGEWIGLAREVYARSFAKRDVIDFDDQLLFPVLLKARVTQYDWVIVDEAQDLSPLQHELVARALGFRGVLVAVGDEAQAIYGFRGAAADSMERLARRFDCRALPLHVSYRCPRAVVAVAQRYVEHIQPHAAAPEGSVDERELPLAEAPVKVGDMVVSRFCAPLVTARLMFLKRGTPAVILGQDLAEALFSLIKKLAPRGIGDLSQRLDKWEKLETDKAISKGKDPSSVQDKADSLRLFMDGVKEEGGAGLDKLTQLISAAFSDDPRARVTLCTIHKAKGLESERVFWINHDARPGQATKDWMLKQEDNMAYVAATRAKSHLAMVRVPRPVRGKLGGA